MESKISPQLQLYNLQKDLQKILTHPDGIDLDHTKLEHPELLHNIIDHSHNPTHHRGLSPIEGLQAYGGGYFLRHLEAFCSDFKYLKEWVGSEFFQEWVIDFLKRHPSRFFSLLDQSYLFGKTLLQNDQPQLNDVWTRSILQFDLSLLEVTFQEVQTTRITSLPPMDQWLSLHFVITPSSRIVLSPLDLTVLWQSEKWSCNYPLQSGDSSRYFLVYRRSDDKIEVEKLTDFRRWLLNFFNESATLGELLTNLECQPNFKMDPAQLEKELMDTFQEWIQKGLISKAL